MSTKPGITRAPAASSSRSPRPLTRPTSTMRLPLMATSAVRSGAPVPSTTVPPRTKRSCSAIACLVSSRRRGEGGGVEAVELGHVPAEDGLALLVGQVARLLGDHVLAPRPRRVAVGEVVGPHEPAPVHGVGEAERGPVVLERRVDVLGEVLARQLAQLLTGVQPVAVTLVGMIHPVHE